MMHALPGADVNSDCDLDSIGSASIGALPESTDFDSQVFEKSKERQL